MSDSAARRPWWLYVAAASFTGYYLLLAFVGGFPPEPFGVLVPLRPDGLVVTRVVAGSAAEAAGVRPGDRQVAADGHILLTDLDRRVVLMNNAVGRPVTIEFDRDGRRFSVTYVPARRVFVGTSTADELGLMIPTVGAVFLITLALALLVAFKRPGDPMSLMGAWLLATLACVGAPMWLRGTAATFRALPLPLGALLWPACLSSLCFCPLLFAFFALFPRRAFASRWTIAAAVVPGLGVAAYAGWYLVLSVYHPDSAFGYPTAEWLNYFGPLSFPAYLLAGPLVLARTYRRLDDANERRRARLLLAGTAAGGLGLLHIAGCLLFGWPWLPAGAAVFLLLPASFAYAVARHRLFDLRFIVRRGLQYALARGAVLSLVPFAAAVLIIDLLVHGDRPLLAIVRDRGWVYAALALFAAAAFTRRHRWMESVDRRFFRERYDARRLMREVLDDIRRAASLTDAAPTVVARIATALHPEFAAVYVAEDRETQYRVLAVEPPGAAPPPISATSKIVGLLRLLATPLQVGEAESGWLSRQLPPDDTAFLRRARIDVLVPIAVESARRGVLLALGAKQSEEPYGEEDLQMLSAIAASLGMLAERGTPAAAAADPATGRTLAGRYQLERPLGRGGMGTVYEARDTALDRRVAVKLIREDLVGLAGVAERFRQEARAAAAFTHPHVVTVHDYGVTDDGVPYLVMELLEGITLRDALRREGKLAPDRVLTILSGVCAATEAAHRRHLVHRDLKPENVFLPHAGGAVTAKVLDFGIAKVLPSGAGDATTQTGSGVLVGTAQYMAPEQIAGGVATPLWDVWAIAIIAWELLTGAHPLAGVRPDYSQMGLPLETFFARALSPDPVLRPQSAQALFDALEEALGT